MSETYRVHVEWLTSKQPHMRLDREVWERAAARHPDVAERLDVSFGTNLDDFAKRISDADFLVTQMPPRGHDLERTAPRLVWVHTTSAGIESFLPLDWLPDGAVFTNNSGTHVPKTREYARMALLMLHLGMPRLVTQQRERVWQQIFDTVIDGRTVAIVGFGAIGQATAEAARELACRVKAVKRSPEPHPLAETVVGQDRLGDALDHADFLVVAAPLTRETRGMIGGAELDRLAAGAGVLNIGRGPIIDTDALCRRLDDGRLSGAIVDVFEQEPLPTESPLWHQRNLVITPHMSSDDPVTYIPRSLDIFFENVRRRIDGQAMTNVVDPALGY